MINFLSVLFFIIIVYSCSSDNKNYKNLDSFLKEEISVNNIDSINWIALINESGCIGCNQYFAKEIKKFINNNNGIILVSASGAIVDISPYIADSVENVFRIDIRELEKLQLINKSGLIFLKDKNIDTIVEIRANDIKEQLNFINSKIDS